MHSIINFKQWRNCCISKRTSIPKPERRFSPIKRISATSNSLNFNTSVRLITRRQCPSWLFDKLSACTKNLFYKLSFSAKKYLLWKFLMVILTLKFWEVPHLNISKKVNNLHLEQSLDLKLVLRRTHYLICMYVCLALTYRTLSIRYTSFSMCFFFIFLSYYITC